MKEYVLTEKQIEMIKKAAKTADRIELIPYKDGTFKILAIKRTKI